MPTPYVGLQLGASVTPGSMKRADGRIVCTHSNRLATTACVSLSCAPQILRTNLSKWYWPCRSCSPIEIDQMSWGRRTFSFLQCKKNGFLIPGRFLACQSRVQRRCPEHVSNQDYLHEEKVVCPWVIKDVITEYKNA